MGEIKICLDKDKMGFEERDNMLFLVIKVDNDFEKKFNENFEKIKEIIEINFNEILSKINNLDILEDNYANSAAK